MFQLYLCLAGFWFSGEVDKLGSPDFDTRHEATKRLAVAGRFARPWVEAGLTSRSPERAERCAALLDRLPSLQEAILLTAIPQVEKLEAKTLAALRPLMLAWVEESDLDAIDIQIRASKDASGAPQTMWDGSTHRVSKQSFRRTADALPPWGGTRETENRIILRALAGNP